MYSTLKYTTLVGDHQRLPPHVAEPESPYENQLMTSDHERKKILHFPVQDMFVEQFKFTIGLNDFSNKQSYNNKLINDSETDLIIFLDCFSKR